MNELSHSLYHDSPKYRNRINPLKLESEDFVGIVVDYLKIDHRMLQPH